jgi:hypothetical protein
MPGAMRPLALVLGALLSLAPALAQTTETLWHLDTGG